MNNIIIHISDLHVTDYTSRLNPRDENSILDTNEANRTNVTYIQKICDIIKDIFPKHNKILLITGDISNAGEEDEFVVAEKYIKIFAEELNLNIENILILPGDHDIHRDSVREAMRKNKKKEGYLFHYEKYKNFSRFLFNKIYNIDFNYDKTIFNITSIGERIVLLSMNSNYKVGERSANGYIELDKFEQEINEIRIKNPNKHILIAFHHNLSGNYDNSITGQWDSANRANFIHLLEKNQVKCIFYGNEHTNRSSKLDSTEIYISDSGSISSKKPLSTFKCYEIEDTESLINIKNHLFSLIQSNAKTESGYSDWTEINPASRKKEEIDNFLIYKKEEIVNDLAIEQLPNPVKNESSSVDLEEKEDLSESKEKTIIAYNSDKYSIGLYDIIKNKKIFYTGHFHWSETSRALNWIDTSKILEDQENLLFAQNAIIDVIETFKLNEDCDLIIGLGYEGNMISTKAAIKYNISYTFLPYSYRYSDHNRFETKLNFSNIEKEFKTVIIITDVVNEGRTIRKLIGKREKDFFKEVKKVIVISLLYTGKEDFVNINLLNYNNLPANYDLANDNEVNKIEYYSVCKLKVGKCPYKDEYREQCPIYKDKLNYVHCFYEEKEK